MEVRLLIWRHPAQTVMEQVVVVEELDVPRLQVHVALHAALIHQLVEEVQSLFSVRIPS